MIRSDAHFLILLFGFFYKVFLYFKFKINSILYKNSYWLSKDKEQYLFSNKKYLFYLYDGEDVKITFLSCQEFVDYHKRVKTPYVKRLFTTRYKFQLMNIFHPLFGIFQSRCESGVPMIFLNYFIGENMHMDKNYVENFNRIINNYHVLLHFDPNERELVFNNIIRYLESLDRRDKITSIIIDSNNDNLDESCDKIEKNFKTWNRVDKLKTIL